MGVLVHANYGRRADLRIAGMPVGQTVTDRMPVWVEPSKASSDDDGSILIVV